MSFFGQKIKQLVGLFLIGSFLAANASMACLEAVNFDEEEPIDDSELPQPDHLMVRVRDADDEEAFGELMRIFEPIVLRIIRKRYRWNPDEHADLMQEIFFGLWITRSNFVGGVGARVVTIACNKISDRISYWDTAARGSATIPLSLLNLDVPERNRATEGTPTLRCLTAELQRQLDVLKGLMSAGGFETFRLYFLENVSVADIATKMGISEKTARARIKRGAVKLTELEAAARLKREEVEEAPKVTDTQESQRRGRRFRTSPVAGGNPYVPKPAIPNRPYVPLPPGQRQAYRPPVHSATPSLYSPAPKPEARVTVTLDETGMENILRPAIQGAAARLLSRRSPDDFLRWNAMRFYLSGSNEAGVSHAFGIDTWTAKQLTGDCDRDLRDDLMRQGLILADNFSFQGKADVLNRDELRKDPSFRLDRQWALDHILYLRRNRTFKSVEARIEREISELTEADRRLALAVWRGDKTRDTLERSEKGRLTRIEKGLDASLKADGFIPEIKEPG